MTYTIHLSLLLQNEIFLRNKSNFLMTFYWKIRAYRVLGLLRNLENYAA